MLDAPLGRTPKEAEEGKLSTYVGGEPETVKAVISQALFFEKRAER